MGKSKSTKGQEVWQKDRLTEVYNYLRNQKGIDRKAFCDALTIGESSLHHWQHYAKPIFQPSMWKKLTPALEKFEINPRYITGESDQMLLQDANTSPTEKWREEMKQLAIDQLNQTKRTADALSELIEVLKFNQ